VITGNTRRPPDNRTRSGSDTGTEAHTTVM
jgi:hypothetical protein